MGQDNKDEATTSTARPGAGRAVTREAMAKIAESIADVAEYSATVHDQMSSRVPGAAEHAARDRRLAAAERAVAAAYRQGRTAPAAARREIIDSRRPADQRESDDQGEIDYEIQQTAYLLADDELEATQRWLDSSAQQRVRRSTEATDRCATHPK